MRLSLWTCHSTKLALANKPEQPRSVSSVLQNRSLLTYHRHTRHTHRCQPLAAVEDDAPSTSSSSTAVTATKGDNTIADIEQVAGVRVIVDDDGNARAEYLVRWKVLDVLWAYPTMWACTTHIPGIHTYVGVCGHVQQHTHTYTSVDAATRAQYNNTHTHRWTQSHTKNTTHAQHINCPHTGWAP